MANWKKIGWITGIGTASLTGLLFVARGVFNKTYDFNELKKLSDQLVVIPSAKIHKIDFTGLTIRIDVKLKNPTDNGFKMKYPFIQIGYNGKVIGSSQASAQVLSIPPNDEFQVDAIMLNFPLIGMLSLIAGLFKSLRSEQAVKIKVATTTKIDPLWKVSGGEWKALKDYGVKVLRAIPYGNIQTVTLKNAAL
jgi:hypothetical protein